MQAFDLMIREIFSAKTGKLGLTEGKEEGRSGQRLIGEDI